MGADIIIWIILLVALVLMGFLTVVVRTLPMATVLLALTSVVLALLLYIAGLTLAAVIELTVSAGLVTAILASAIALLKPAADTPGAPGATGAAGAVGVPGVPGAPAPQKNARLARYLPLPIIMLLLAAAILIMVPGTDISLPALSAGDATAQDVLWGERALDIIGLTLLILAGVLGVTALIKRREGK